jgi:HEAT repeat protein
MRYNQALIILATGICAAGVARAQGDDWMQYIRDGLSTDRVVREAADKGMREALEDAMHEDAASVRRHLASIAPALEDKNDQARLAAAGICYFLSQFHENSADVLAPSIPALLPLTRDRNSRVRENAFRALGLMRPKVPQEVVSAMHEFVRDPDSTARGMAMFIIARSFAPGSDDERLLEKLLSDPQSLIRKTAVEAVGLAMAPGYTYVARPPVDKMIELLRQRLSDPDSDVVRSTIRAVDEIGPPAISAKDDLQKIVDANTDPGLSQAAAGAIRRITAPPPPR